jgi:transcriptional antiterminator RfaH
MTKQHPEKQWYAFYLRSRSEKRVSERISEAGTEVYLPLIRTLKRWNDRKKWVEEPLIKSYIFVYIHPTEIYRILQTEAVVKVVSFSGDPAPVPDIQIENLRQIIASGSEVVVTTETYEKGDMIEVVSGPLAGIRGQLIALKGKHKIMVSIDNLQCSILVTLNPNQVKKKVLLPDSNTAS